MRATSRVIRMPSWVTSASALSCVCFKVLGRRRRNHEKPHRKRPCGWGGDLLWPEVECVEEELAMPLTTTGEPGYYEPSTDNIGFWMLNGPRERQRCAVTLEAREKLKTGLLRGIAEQIGSSGKREVRQAIF